MRHSSRPHSQSDGRRAGSELAGGIAGERSAVRRAPRNGHAYPGPGVSFPDGGFEQASGNRFTEWDLQDKPGEYTFCDTAVKHSGKSSVRIENLGQANRDEGFFIGKTINVAPFHEYRVSVWVKTDQCRSKDLMINVRGKARPAQGKYEEHPGDFHTNIHGEGPNANSLCFAPFEIRWTQDWQKHSIIFNSLDNTKVNIRFGAWAIKSGRMWWDDAQIEEVGLVNVLRRPGTPVVVKGEDGTVYEEGKDYKPISDPLLNIERVDHEPPAIRLTPTSRISEGQRLRVSYYHPVLIHYGCSLCLSEPAVFEEYRRQVQQVNEELHPKAFFMQHDEIRIANWCEACQSKHMTPGQLLADNVRKCVAIIKEIRPDAKIWVWNDMFDPLHNAHEDYYLVNGDLTGSWEGLPPEVGIVNWAHHLKGKNFSFFATRGHEQILSGYYGEPRDRDGTETLAWLKAGEGVPGIVGVMYTAWWYPELKDLSAWAQGVWGSERGDEGMQGRNRK